jgi:hypothetical protein
MEADHGFLGWIFASIARFSGRASRRPVGRRKRDIHVDRI